MFLYLSPNSAPPLPHVRGFPALRVLPVGPTSTAASASLWMVLSVCILDSRQDYSGSPRFLDASLSIRAMLSDPAEVSSNHRPFCRLPTIAFQVFDLVGPRSCNEALSLHFRYGPNVALSTLSPCRYLHAPKTRFLVSWLCSFQGREFHPLKAPGFSWRTEESTYIILKYPVIPPTTLASSSYCF